MGAYEKRVVGRWAVEFFAAMLLYGVTVTAVAIFLREHPDHPAKMIVALVPIIPSALVIWAGWRGFKRMDEMQRKFTLEVTAIAAFATALLTFGYGFLEGVGLPRLSMFVVWPVMGTLQGLLSFTSRWWYFR